MSIERYAITRFRPRAPWLLIGGAVAAAALYGAANQRHQRGHAATLHHTLHVELASGHAAGELRAEVAVLGGRHAWMHPLFAHPEPALAGWYDVIVSRDADVVARAL